MGNFGARKGLAITFSQKTMGAQKRTLLRGRKMSKIKILPSSDYKVGYGRCRRRNGRRRATCTRRDDTYIVARSSNKV